MKKVILGSILAITIPSIIYAGGDLLPTVFETEEVFVPIEEAYIEPIQEPIQIVEPTPAPIVTEPKAIVVPPKPLPIPVPAPAIVLEEILPLGLYVAGGLALANYDPQCGCTTSKGKSDKTAGIIARIGYDFNEYIGLEGRGIRTNWKSHGGKIKHLGLFAKPMYPVSKDINIYGLAGYAKTTTQGSKRRVDAQTLAWGAGVEYDFGKDSPKKGKYNRSFDGYGDQEKGWGLFADYERLVQKSGSPDLDTLNVGITYDF